MDPYSQKNLFKLTGSSSVISGFLLDENEDAVPGRKLILLSPGNEFQDIVQSLYLGGWGVFEVSNITALEASNAAKACHVGLVCLDRLDDSGLAHVEEYVRSNWHTEWIALASPDALHSRAVCRFIKSFCFDYHIRPVDMGRLLMTVGHAYGKARLGKERQAEIGTVGRFGMIGNSSAIEEIYRNIEKIHSISEPVLIGGESGTGKELVARAIHQLSHRHDKPFIAVNCGALPPSLIQSELFGHERGAFTGAHQRKIGRIEAASGGTIFLDEIGDLPMELQVNLLHFLQDKTIERVGSNHSIAVDARVIAASHVDLPKAIAQGRFREDLYYRINVLHMKVPPLRERGDDIILLAQEYFKRFSKDRKYPAHGFSQESLRVMEHYAWPGNVRELINRVRHAMVMSESRLLLSADLGLDQPVGKPNGATLGSSRGKADQEYVQRVLISNHNNVSEAARELGVSRATMYRLISKFSEKHVPES